MVWKNRQGLFSGPGRVFRTLAVLIESGVVYTLLWVCSTSCEGECSIAYTPIGMVHSCHQRRSIQLENDGLDRVLLDTSYGELLSAHVTEKTCI